MTDAQNAFSLLAVDLLNDPDDDVELTDDGLRVHGSLFAFVDGDDLVVRLSPERSDDLEQRGIATAYSGAAGERWVVVGDRELWSELASEAHAFVGEPPVGRQS